MRASLYTKQIIRSFTTVNKEALAQKEIYKNQMQELRKKWAHEYDEKQKRIALEKKDEQEKRTLEMAKLLRIKRADALRRQEIDRKLKQKFHDDWIAKLAQNKVKKEEKMKQDYQNFHKHTEDLLAESKYWLTEDNIDKLITENLFDTPSTTGIISHTSDNWRYTTLTTNIWRLLDRSHNLDDTNEDDYNEESSKIKLITDKLQSAGNKEYEKTEVISTMLNELINNGEDREKYEDMIELYSDSLENDYNIAIEDGYNIEYNSDEESFSEYSRRVKSLAYKYEGKELPSKDNDDYSSSDDEDNQSNRSTIEMGGSTIATSILNKKENDLIDKLNKHYEKMLNGDEKKDKFIDENQEILSTSTSTNIQKSSQKLFKSIDELISDLEYIDENDTIALERAYRTIRNRLKYEPELKKVIE